MLTKYTKKLTLNYGIGANTCKKIHEQFGLNIRNSPLFIKKKIEQKIEKKFFTNKTGKILKTQIKTFQAFKKKLKI